MVKLDEHGDFVDTAPQDKERHRMLASGDIPSMPEQGAFYKRYCEMCARKGECDGAELSRMFRKVDGSLGCTRYVSWLSGLCRW